ncbi:DUF6192 family protein [Amycolatopsis speibonae]|uniref:DUF6192 family protein n=1 Tax=Amycolatopsis speibonae TaxID=1450224 RepID=A0ABV7P6G6_9PSEU
MEHSSRSEILGLLYATTSFYSKAGRLVLALTDAPLTTDDRDLVLDRLQRVRAAAEWAEHAVTTGDTTMPPPAAAVLKRRYRRRGRTA